MRVRKVNALDWAMLQEVHLLCSEKTFKKNNAKLCQLLADLHRWFELVELKNKTEEAKIWNSLMEYFYAQPLGGSNTEEQRWIDLLVQNQSITFEQVRSLRAELKLLLEKGYPDHQVSHAQKDALMALIRIMDPEEGKDLRLWDYFQLIYVGGKGPKALFDLPLFKLSGDETLKKKNIAIIFEALRRNVWSQYEEFLKFNLVLWYTKMVIHIEKNPKKDSLDHHAILKLFNEWMDTPGNGSNLNKFVHFIDQWSVLVTPYEKRPGARIKPFDYKAPLDAFNKEWLRWDADPDGAISGPSHEVAKFFDYLNEERHFQR